MDMAMKGGPCSMEVQKALRGYLNRCQAATLDCLSEAVGLPRSRVYRELGRLARAGHVSRLRPLTPAGCRSVQRARLRNIEYFRLVRETDLKCLWQQGVPRPVARERIADCIEADAPAWVLPARGTRPVSDVFPLAYARVG